MNKRQRVLAAIHGDKPDQIPVAFWRHWPKDEDTAEGLAKVVVRWQEMYDCDLVKVTPASGFSAEDWGARFVPNNKREGTRDCVERPVKHAHDWEKLWPLDVTSGKLGRELQTLRLVRAKVGPDVFVLSTVFSPLTIARTLAGDEVWLTSLRNHPQEMRRGLAIIADTYARFAEETLKAGADGVFFATQCATRDLLSEDEYEEFGIPYDRHVLGAVAGSAGLIMVHIHGLNIMFDLVVRSLPANIVNWHDRRTPPSLAKARRRTPLALMGGVNEYDLADGTPESVRAQVRDAIAQVPDHKFLVGAGCVVTIDTPEANLRAAIAEARS